MMTMTSSLHSLAKTIDHSLLHPTLTDQGIREGCELARKYGVATVCVKPYSIRQTKSLLTGSDVGVCAVVAFPHGNSTTSNKVKEAEEAVHLGATEIDMVVNVGKVLGGDWAYVSTEIEAINDCVVGKNALLKVIFENDFLEDRQIISLCEICSSHRVAFVKTSTGYGFVRQADGSFSYKGATDHHLELMRKHCNESVQIKAAGGIRTLDDMLRAIKLGATRIGASATQSIIEEAGRRGIQ
jgi:deoxyribose-phosphate aldolase